MKIACVHKCSVMSGPATLWTAAPQDPLSTAFSRQEYWSGLPFSPPRNLSLEEIKPECPVFPALPVRFFTTEPPGKSMWKLAFIKHTSESHSVMSNSLWPHGLYSLQNSPGQNTAVCSHPLLQWIFPTQGSNPGLPYCRQILYQLNHQGSPRILAWVPYLFSSGSSQPRNQPGVSCSAGGFFTDWATREALNTRENCRFLKLFLCISFLFSYYVLKVLITLDSINADTSLPLFVWMLSLPNNDLETYKV